VTRSPPAGPCAQVIRPCCSRAQATAGRRGARHLNRGLAGPAWASGDVRTPTRTGWPQTLVRGARTRTPRGPHLATSGAPRASLQARPGFGALGRGCRWSHVGSLVAGARGKRG